MARRILLVTLLQAELIVRQAKHDQARIVRAAPSPEAVYWRTQALHAGQLGFWVHAYLEPLYGRIAMADRRTNSTRGLLDYVVAFANHEDLQYLPRYIRAERDNDEHAQAMLTELTDEAVEKRREEMRTILRAAVTPSAGLNFEKQSDDLLQLISDRIKTGIDWTVSTERNAGLRTFGLVRSPDAFVGVVMGLLLDQKNRDMLVHCRNDDCGRLDLVKHTEGTTRRHYCSDDCMLKINTEGNAARQRDRYKRNRAADFLSEEFPRMNTEIIKAAVKQAFKNSDEEITAEQLARRAKPLLKRTK